MKKELLKAILFISIALFTLESTFIAVNAANLEVTANSHNIAEVVPLSVDGVTYFPLRSIFEAFEWKVKWDSKLRKVTCQNAENSIEFVVGSKELICDNWKEFMDYPLVIKNNTSYVPKKLIIEKLGLKIRWNKKDNLIILAKGDTSSITINGGSNIVIVGDGIIVNIFEPCNKDTLEDMINYADSLLAINNPVEALQKYKEILDNISPEEMPDLYARVTNNMGNSYNMLAEINNPGKNILDAIRSYSQAMEFYKLNDDIYCMSTILNNMGNAYKSLADITGDTNHLEQALSQYIEALKFYTSKDYPLDYALIKYNMGMVYENMGLTDIAEECLQSAKDVFESSSSYTSPQSYAFIQYNLGNIYSAIRYRVNDDEFIRKSEACYKNALKVWTAESYPINYAKARRCLGYLYSKAFESGYSEEYFDKAEAEYRESLKIYTMERYPFSFAKVNLELGNLYISLAKAMEKVMEKTMEETMEKEKSLSYAAKAYENSLKVFTPSDYTIYYKSAQSGLMKSKISIEIQ